MSKQIAENIAAFTHRPRHPRRTDGTKFVTPGQLADRWGWHPESIRRLLRKGKIESVVLSRRRLIPIGAVERIEAEGHIARTV